MLFEITKCILLPRTSLEEKKSKSLSKKMNCIMALQFINTNNNPRSFEEVYFYIFNNVTKTNWYTIISTKLNPANMFTFIFSENLIALYRKLRQCIYWAHLGIRNCEPSLWTGKRSDFWRSANARSLTS